jgi:hypothetical protein
VEFFPAAVAVLLYHSHESGNLSLSFITAFVAAVKIFHIFFSNLLRFHLFFALTK